MDRSPQLAPPDKPSPPVKPGDLRQAEIRREYPGVAKATYFEANIYRDPRKNYRIIGLVRRGMHVRVRAAVKGTGCKSGQWYPVLGGGYICSSSGFKVVQEIKGTVTSFRPPKVSAPLPYPYAKVVDDDALRLYKRPSPLDLRRISLAEKGKRGWPSIVQRRMDGIYFLALDRAEVHQGEKYFRTVRGRYVKAEHLKRVGGTSLRGEHLTGARPLPLAFVFGEDRPIFCDAGDSLQVCGEIKRHQHFMFRRAVQLYDQELVVLPSGQLMERAAVRIAKKVARPKAIPAGVRWVHIDLDSQSLVAYEGERPVFATLISSGREGYTTPTGTYRIKEKHVTTTMRGREPGEGWYEVGEVPWTMFYKAKYAVHGAYWHNDFGQTRSHGCTNLAPADARWLFNWSSPEVPAGWHSRWQSGTWIHFTNK